MAFDRKTFVIPPGTVFDERLVTTPGDVVLGDHVRFGFGVKAEGRLFGGQGIEVDGTVSCKGELRLDQSSHVLGDVDVGGNAWLGERCFVGGLLSLEGDLDVGDDVRIGGALKAKGWVQKRSPVPLVLYLFIYLLELLRLGHSKEVEKILAEMEGMNEGDLMVGDVFLFVPDGSQVGLQSSEVKGGLEVGEKVRVLGNYTVRGKARVGAGATVHGALRADGDVVLAPGSEVQGELVSGGHVVVGQGCQVLGDLKAHTVEMHAQATVDGKIVAEGGVTFRSESQEEAQKAALAKVEEFKGKAGDLVDLLG